MLNKFLRYFYWTPARNEHSQTNKIWFGLTFRLSKFFQYEAHVPRRDGCTTHTYEPHDFHVSCLAVWAVQPNWRWQNHTSKDCKGHFVPKKLNCFLIHAQPPQTIEWIDHLKLCVVLHDLLFSTQRHRRWICTLQPLSHSVPFAHMTGCWVVSELSWCHIVGVQEPSTTRPTRVLIVNQV